jgi:hypothetical protein
LGRWQDRQNMFGRESSKQEENLNNGALSAGVCMKEGIWVGAQERTQITDPAGVADRSRLYAQDIQVMIQLSWRLAGDAEGMGRYTRLRIPNLDLIPIGGKT